MYYEMQRMFKLTTIILLCLFFSNLIFAQNNQSFNNEDISEAIELDLVVDDYVSSHLIDVKTIDGIVTLSGKVNNLLEKERSEKIAESIKGVRAVVNEITVNPPKISDEELKGDIEFALLLDPVVSSFPLTVQVSDGEVTLNGTTGSWTEMQLAKKVVKGVKGVREFNNSIDIIYDEEYSDLEIKDAIERNLSLDPYVGPGLIDISVNSGNVSLSGSVGSAAEKSFLFSNVWVAGVNSVDDSNVKVSFWADDEMKRKSKIIIKTDQDIQNAVVDAFLFDPRVNAFKINVQVDNGFVTLSGIVDNLKAKKSANNDARNTIGVVGVANNIKVRPVEKYTDKEIKDNITRSLGLDPIVEMQNLNVIVRNQEAYLYGSADTYGEKIHAEDIASLASGVVEVNNYITVVDNWVYKTDSKIKSDIEDELFWSFLIDDNDISVTVEDGIATLTGDVGSTAELSAAIDNSFEGGAKSVVSKLEIADQPNYEFRDYYTAFPYFMYEY